MKNVGESCRGYMEQVGSDGGELFRNRKCGTGISTLGISHKASSILASPPEPAPEASKSGLVVRARFGRVSRTKSRLPPPAEANGTTSKEQKNERDEGHPKGRCGIGHKVRVAQFPHFMLDKREEGYVNSERDEGEEGGEEGSKGGEEGNCDVGREREEKSDE